MRGERPRLRPHAADRGLPGGAPGTARRQPRRAAARGPGLRGAEGRAHGAAGHHRRGAGQAGCDLASGPGRRTARVARAHGHRDRRDRARTQARRGVAVLRQDV